MSNKNKLYQTTIQTPLEPMIAIADEKALYLLEFFSRKNLEKYINRLLEKTQASLIEKKTQPLISIEKELNDYFSGKLTTFKTPIKILGTPFQNKVWDQLQTIPFGTTWSYQQLANSLGNKAAFRAVANANAQNNLALIVPCHRVIKKDGHLAGYGGGGTKNKQWLLEHEKNS